MNNEIERLRDNCVDRFLRYFPSQDLTNISGITEYGKEILEKIPKPPFDDTDCMDTFKDIRQLMDSIFGVFIKSKNIKVKVFFPKK